MTLGHWETRKLGSYPHTNYFTLFCYISYINNHDEKHGQTNHLLFIYFYLLYYLIGIGEKTVGKESLGDEVENDYKVNVEIMPKTMWQYKVNLVTATMSFLPCVNDAINDKEAVNN